MRGSTLPHAGPGVNAARAAARGFRAVTAGEEGRMHFIKIDDGWINMDHVTNAWVDDVGALKLARAGTTQVLTIYPGPGRDMVLAWLDRHSHNCCTPGRNNP